MDPVSLILTLLLLAATAAAAYFVYQKIIVAGGLFETTPTAPIVSEPTSSLGTPGEVAGGVPGVDNMKGRPGSAAIVTGSDATAPSKINYYGGGEKLIPNGDAKTADVCRDYSRTMGINNWGWDRRNKSCFAYIDGAILTAMGEKEANKVEGKNEYIVGCTEPGLQVLDGCLDLTKGNLVKGFRSAGGHTDVDNKVMTVEGCRAYANENGYEAVGYRTNRHRNINGNGSCFFYNDAETGLKGYVGDNTSIDHLSFCTDPSKKVIDGCQ